MNIPVEWKQLENRMNWLAGSLLTIPFYFLSFPVLAHEFSDENSVFEAPEVLEDSVALSNSDLQIAQSVVDQYKLWEAGQTLRVCFLSGDQDSKDFFVATSAIWDKVVSTNFDFGTRPEYSKCSSTGDFHIRVSLNTDGGNWSYVGTDSTRVGQSEPSLHISIASPFSINNKRKLGGTILHELGHALALQHEHQSPESKCEEDISWPVVYDQLSKPPNSWTNDKIDNNLRPLISSARLRTSDYDPKSIMHYALPAAWFKNGSSSKCYTQRNNNLSDLDIEAAQASYPEIPQQQDEYLQELDKTSAEALAKTGVNEEGIRLINAIINRVLSAAPDRQLQTQLEVDFNNINATTSGDCSQIINKAGDVTIICD